MNRISFFIYPLLIVVIAAVSCKQPTAETAGMASVKLHVKNAEGQTLLLEDVNGSIAIPVDTAVVNNGKAAFSAAVTPGIYRLRALTKNVPQMPLLFLDGNTRLDLSLDLDDPLEYTVKGDEANALLKETLTEQSDVRQQSMALIGQIQSAADPAVRDSLNQQHIRLINGNGERVKATIEKSKAYDPNLTAFMLNLLDPNANAAYIVTQLQELQAKDPDSRLVAEMLKRFEPQQPAGGVAIGKTAPDIIQASPGGKPLALSELRGKYVLIDFWASWCRPCRYENPNVVKTYKAYKDKGFDIYSVSLDKDKGRWIKAIEEDNLVWNSHVSDLQGWSNAAARLYGVGSIPATFLIDPEGVVIARNLRGPALEQKLAEIFAANN